MHSGILAAIPQPGRIMSDEEAAALKPIALYALERI